MITCEIHFFLLMDIVLVIFFIHAIVSQFLLSVGVMKKTTIFFISFGVKMNK